MAVRPIPLMPLKSNEFRMRHFDSDVFDTSESSYLFRFIDALCGETGAGDLKKAIFQKRLMTGINTITFQDLDRLFDGAFGLPRFLDETYAYDPEHQLLTSEQWDEVYTKDALYRERLKKFFMALGAGGTPEGLRLAVESVYGGDCKVLEVWKYLDSFGFSSTSQQPNQLISGDFENPNDVNSWTATNATIQPSNKDSSVFPVYAGSGSATVTPTTTDDLVKSLIIPVVQGSTYSASIAAIPSEDNQTITLSLEFLDAAGTRTSRINQAITFPVPQWQLIKVEGQTATSGFARINVSGGGKRFLIDEAAIVSGGRAFDAQVDSNVRLGRSGGNWRNEVVLVPVVPEPLSPEEFTSRKARLIHLVDRIRPQDSVVTIDYTGLQQSSPTMIRAVGADSQYFEVQRQVTGVPNIMSMPTPEYTAHDIIMSAWWESGKTTPAPTTAFGTTQENSVYYVADGSATSPIGSAKYMIQNASGSNLRESPSFVRKLSESDTREFTPIQAVSAAIPTRDSTITTGWIPNTR